MEVQSLMANASILVKDGIPSIKHDSMTFSSVKTQLAQQQGDTAELDIYELLHVLYDDYDDEFNAGLSRQQLQEYQLRIRKDRLSKFLAELVWRRHGERIRAASKVNAATVAIMHLTTKNVHAACDALMQEKNFHLTLLIAQIEQADSSFQDDIATQITDWREQNVISEMGEEMRALYEVLAGNTSIVQGKQNVPVEDRASTFAISEKFELDWVQAFAMCLWYGRHKNDAIAAVVAEFQDKLSSNVESATPVGGNGYEDPLWIVLKLFASGSASKGKARASAARVEEPVLPQALSALSQPWDSRRTFRLHNALTATLQGVSIDQDKADDLALSLAFEYSAHGSVAGATYALLHLSDPAKRTHQIESLLNHHAAILPASPTPQAQSAPLWTALTTSFHIPTKWIYRSKALYAQSCNEPLAEFNYLILATDYSQAHGCLLRRIAPRLVIDEDWQGLEDVLGQFGEGAAQKVDSAITALKEQDVGPEWKSGGQVYADFVGLIALMQSSVSRRRGPGQDASDVQMQKKALLERLHTSLTDMDVRFRTSAGNSDMSKDREKLEERVALCEMGKAVARVIEVESEDGVLSDKV